MNTLQQEALNCVEVGANVFLTGCPGTGKTYCLNAIIKHCRQQEENIGVTAATGCAAILLNGSTLHSFLSIGLAKQSAEVLYTKLMSQRYPAKVEKFKQLRELQTLIIDEISMINAELLQKVSDYLKLIKQSSRPFGGVQIILVGDFYQLPPVSGKFCFEADVWQEADLFTVVLEEQMRQIGDTVFKDILGRARIGKVSDEDLQILARCEGAETEVKYTKLYSLNVNVDDINGAEMKKLMRQTPRPECGSFKIDQKESLMLCIGAQVMITRNIDTTSGIVNGTRGVVKSFLKLSTNEKNTRNGKANGKADGKDREYKKGDKYCIGLTLVDGSEYFLSHYEFRDDETEELLYVAMPVKLAWAITIHKSQGSTIDCLEIDLGPSVFAPGQAYTGLSRAVSLARVRITDINPHAFKVSRTVEKFYEGMAKKVEAAVDLEPVAAPPVVPKDDVVVAEGFEPAGAPAVVLKDDAVVSVDLEPVEPPPVVAAPVEEVRAEKKVRSGRSITVPELKKRAKELKIKGFSKLKKAELEEAIAKAEGELVHSHGVTVANTIVENQAVVQTT